MRKTPIQIFEVSVSASVDGRIYLESVIPSRTNHGHKVVENLIEIGAFTSYQIQKLEDYFTDFLEELTDDKDLW